MLALPLASLHPMICRFTYVRSCNSLRNATAGLHVWYSRPVDECCFGPSFFDVFFSMPLFPNGARPEHLYVGLPSVFSFIHGKQWRTEPNS